MESCIECADGRIFVDKLCLEIVKVEVLVEEISNPIVWKVSVKENLEEEQTKFLE